MIPTSNRLTADNARQAPGSTRPIAAETMTAPSTADGKYDIGVVRNRSTRAIAPAATSPAICVRAPIWSFTAVREPLAPSGKPCVIPAAALNPEKASSSWFARMCWLRFPANVLAVRMPSAKLTRKMPRAAGTSLPTSASGGLGIVTLGRPDGISPTTATP